MQHPNILALVKEAAERGFHYTAQIIRQYPIEQIICTIAGQGEPIKTAFIGGNGVYPRTKDGHSAYLAEVLAEFKANVDRYEAIYNRLSDNASRLTFNFLMCQRLYPAPQLFELAFDANHPQYFDRGIITTNENEVFVDCGAYTGDTVQGYIKHMGKYKHIYAYEPDPDQFITCQKNLSNLENISLRNAGVSVRSDVLQFTRTGASSTFANRPGKGISVPIISLDEDILEPVTFIKMDIEGFEIEAINGARRHITNEKPKLAICLYHVLSDFWEIPTLVHSLNPDYNLYVRHYHRSYYWETVLYAV